MNSMAMYRHVIEEIKEDAPIIIADIGCSIGYGSYILSKEIEDLKVVGLDIDGENIKEAVRIFQGQNLSFAEVDITNPNHVSELLKKTGIFDVIVCFEVFEHIPSEKTTVLLNSIRNMLKPGGLVFISTPNREIYRINAYTTSHINEVSLEEFLDLLRSFEFEVKDVWGVDKQPSISSSLLMRFGLVRREKEQRIELSPFQKLLRKTILSLFGSWTVFSIVLHKISIKRFLNWKYRNAINHKPEWSHLIFVKALASTPMNPP